MTPEQIVEEYESLASLLMAINAHSRIPGHLDGFQRLMEHHAACVEALRNHGIPLPVHSVLDVLDEPLH